MSWIVTVAKEDRADGSRVVLLTYTDGNRTVKEGFDIQGVIDNDYLAARAKAKIDWLTTQDASVAAISEGSLTPKAIVPPPTPDPTPAELAKKKFMADVLLLGKLNKAVAAGFLTSNDQIVTDQKNLVLSEFKIEYLDVL